MNEIKKQELSLNIEGCKLTSKGATFESNLSFEKWQAIGSTLRYLEKSVLFWIGDWINYGEKLYGEKYAQAMDSTGYDYQTLQNASYVARNVEISRRRENVLFSHHAEVASLSPEKQNEMLDKTSDEKLTVRELRQVIQKEKTKINLAIPSNKYRVIYADPPWFYGDNRKGLVGYTSADDHYPVMTIDELCAMDVESRTQDNAVLFMWVTSPLLDECWPVIKAWGFEYKTSIIWDKDAHNFGHYVSVRHELLLICTKGSCTPEIDKLRPSVIKEKRSDKHSEKPECFRELIDELYPSGKRIELFSRKKVKNWDSFGNEV